MLSFRSFASSSHGNVNIISDGITTIMLDCGMPWRWIQKQMNFETSSVAAICVTHQHNDHVKGVISALKFGKDVFVSQETKDALDINGHHVHIFNPLNQFKIGTFRIKPFPVKHDIANYGFLMSNSQGEKFVYITDTPYCEYRFTGLTRIFIECNYQLDILNENIKNGSIDHARKLRLLRSHFSLANVCKMLKANDLSHLKEVWLLHLSHGNSDEQNMINTIARITGTPVYVAEG